MTRGGDWGAGVPAHTRRASPASRRRPASPRTPVARLVVSHGEEVEVDRVVLVGRAPEARRFTSTEQPRLVTVPSPQQEISSTHLEVRPGSGADHGSAVVTDLGSTNGTVLVQPGLPPEPLQPGIAVQLHPRGASSTSATASASRSRGAERRGRPRRAPGPTARCRRAPTCLPPTSSAATTPTSSTAASPGRRTPPSRGWPGGCSTARSAVLLVVLGWVLVVQVGLAALLGLRGLSPGKALLGLRAVSERTGDPVGVGPALLRGLVVGLAGPPTLLLGAAMLAWTSASDRGRRRRGWHDHLAGTLVVDLRPAPEHVEVDEVRPRGIVNLTAMRLVPPPARPASTPPPSTPPPAPARRPTAPGASSAGGAPSGRAHRRPARLLVAGRDRLGRRARLGGADRRRGPGPARPGAGGAGR